MIIMNLDFELLSQVVILDKFDICLITKLDVLWLQISNVLFIFLFSVIFNYSYHKTAADFRICGNPKFQQCIYLHAINDNNIITCCFRGYHSTEGPAPKDTLRFCTGW